MAEFLYGELKEIVSPIMGKKSWGAALGVGSFITIEFGNSIVIEKTNKSHGEWHLWIYCCSWRMEVAGITVAASDYDREEIEGAMFHLNGKTLLDIEFGEMIDAKFNFSGDAVLKTFCSYKNCDQWYLYMPSKTITISSENKWKVEHRD